VLGGFSVPLAAPPTDLAPLAFLAPAALWLALRGRSPRDGALLGLVGGLAANLVGFRWAVGLLEDFAALPLPLCLLLWVLLALGQSLGWAAVGLAVAWLERRGVAARWSLPCALVVAEWAVPSIFPWTLALTQHRVLPLVQIAEVAGTAGPTLVVAFAGTLLAEAAVTRRLRPAIAALAIVGATAGLGVARIAQLEAAARSRPAVRVGIAQPSVGILDKHDPRQFAAHLRNLQELTMRLEAQRAELVVWPESSYPYTLPTSIHRDGERGMPRVRRRGRVPILFGAMSRSPDRRQRFNSAFLVAEDGAIGAPVHKHHLLVFGETVPLYRQLPFLQRAFPRAEGFTPGPGPGVLVSGRIRAGVFNCYEDILSDFGRAMAAERPNVLVNVTNDAWFGDTAEPHLHNALAIFRAIELRRELVRAVNTGVSSHIDVTGRIVRRTGTFERTTLLAEVRLWEGETFYARFGDWLAWSCLAALVGAWALARSRR
jgi:apolipoprotein N-acyltransferase